MKQYKNIGTKLIINGFTINPILDEESFKSSLMGIANYKDIHFCDYVEKQKTISHKNYLKKRIKSPFVNYLDNKNTRGWVGYQLLENGYYILKFWDNVYPARIQFDLYLDEKMHDADLIIDGLCAPAVPFDGFGMFDYSYSLSYITKNSSILEKENFTPSYKINEPFNYDSYINNIEDYKITLNQLDKIHCYFCNNDGKYFIFKQNKDSVVPVCKEHKVSGTQKEFGANQEEYEDIRTVKKYNENYLMEVVEEGGIMYTINKDMEKNG